jgi:hypothetical protein
MITEIAWRVVITVAGTRFHHRSRNLTDHPSPVIRSAALDQ